MNTKALLFVFCSLFLFGTAFASITSEHFVDGTQVSNGSNVNTGNPFTYKIVIYNNEYNKMICRFVVNAANLGQNSGQVLVNNVAVPDKNNNLFFVNAPIVLSGSSFSSSSGGSYLAGETDSDSNNDGQQGCTPNWQCSDWTACQVNGLQSRTCVDASNCGVADGKPRERKTCYFEPVGLNGNGSLIETTGAGLNGNNNNGNGFTGFFGLGAGTGNIVAGIVAIALLVFGAVSFNNFRKKQLKK